MENIAGITNKAGIFTKQPEVLKEIVKNQDAVLYDSFNEALIDLKSGRIDGLLMDKVYR